MCSGTFCCRFLPSLFDTAGPPFTGELESALGRLAWSLLLEAGAGEAEVSLDILLLLTAPVAVSLDILLLLTAAVTVSLAVDSLSLLGAVTCVLFPFTAWTDEVLAATLTTSINIGHFNIQMPWQSYRYSGVMNLKNKWFEKNNQYNLSRTLLHEIYSNSPFDPTI